jgi:hypothetical protein
MVRPLFIALVKQQKMALISHFFLDFDPILWCGLLLENKEFRDYIFLYPAKLG